MGKHIISYVSGPYANRRDVIGRQMAEAGWFDGWKVFTPEDLAPEFLETFASVFRHGRGGGYWIWKPWIIRRYRDTLRDGDVLVYLDGGCTIRNTEAARSRFQDYLQMLESSGKSMLRFAMDAFSEYQYTNTYTRKFFERHFGTGPREFRAGQVNATVIIMLKTPDTVFFFDKVMELLAMNPKIITDAYNPIHPHRDFKAHRSDQSIMSLLAKMLPTSHFIPDETYYLDFEAIHHIPFLATRLRA